MTGTVSINRLRLRAHIGVLPQEQIVGNDYLVSVALRYDASRAMTADNISDALNYAAAVEVIQATLACPMRLLEHAAYAVHAALVARFHEIMAGSVTIEKPTPPIAAEMQSVAFTLEW